ncbi:MAG TPA: HAD family hydrolase [Candidatus Baltobacteraceae bacterium]|jgi:phosphoglycolate phosphatase-like HAD superfamily hydrolase|nr:HAD family hydrolase [Candidatus Baltobacteraceae bacterium]
MSLILVQLDIDSTLIKNGGVSEGLYPAAFWKLTGKMPTTIAETEGRTEPQIIANLFIAQSLPIPPKQRILEALEWALRDSAQETRLLENGYVLPGVFELLTYLRDRPQVFIPSVLTGNIEANARYKLHAFGLLDYLDARVGSYGSDDDDRTKLVAISQRRVEKKYHRPFSRGNTVVIGDTALDIRAGIFGGACVVAVGTGEDSVRVLEDAAQQFESEAIQGMILPPNVRNTAVVIPDLRNIEVVIEAMSRVLNRLVEDPPVSMAT